MEIPRNFAAEIKKIVLDFIWKQKLAKIKRTTLVKTKSEGGLGMKVFDLFDKALKLTWVKRLLQLRCTVEVYSKVVSF